MNQAVRPRIAASACPHDCPSTCALEVEVFGKDTIGRVRGAEDNTYTAGVICAKVARYAERVHHPDRLKQPLRRTGPKGSGSFAPVSWDEALDIVAGQFIRAEQTHGSETVWPYLYAGTMGYVMRDGIHRLRHVKKYSGFFSTICVNPAWSGFIAGTGRLAGTDPREMAKSDLVVIWGTNAVNTQVNVMTHATRARKERGAKIVAVDIYMNGTMRQADLPVLIRPGTDGALACAVMHCLFRDGKADQDYLERYTDAPQELAAHVRTRDPAWASRITGAPVETIEEFARLAGAHPRAYYRLGYGFSRSRNGAINMHAASCIAAVTGAWRHEGGGAFHNNGAVFHLDGSLIEGTDCRDPSIRMLDQSRIGAVLTGDAGALLGGPPVTAMLIQNTNPVSVAPDQEVVKRGFARDDLFVCVHEQFMTDTAKMADVILPATMFVEHDDFYTAGGNQNILFGPKLIEPPGECRSNHEVICALASRLGAAHPGFAMTPRELIDATLQKSGWGTLANLRGQSLDRLPAGFRDRALPQRLCVSGRQVSLQARLAERPIPALASRPQCAVDAHAAGPLGSDRGGRHRASVPAGNVARARLSQLDLHRNADLACPRAAADCDDPSRGRRSARGRRRRRSHARQPARQGAPACATVRRRTPRRADRGIALAELRLCRRPRHQHADRG